MGDCWMGREGEGILVEGIGDRGGVGEDVREG